MQEERVHCAGSIASAYKLVCCMQRANYIQLYNDYVIN
jgi:hypothetical protein